MNKLQLEEFSIISEKTIGSECFLFDVEPIQYKPFCPQCGSTLYNVHGQTIRKIRDLKIDGKNVYISIHGKRYICLKCRKTYGEEYRCIEKNEVLTKRLKAHLITGLIIHTYQEMASRYALSVSTVKRVFNEFDEYTKQLQVLKAPHSLGLFYFDIGQTHYVCAIDLDENMLLEIIPEYSTLEIMHLMDRIHERERIQVVFIEPVIEVYEFLTAYLPDAEIIILKNRALSLISFKRNTKTANTLNNILNLSSCAEAFKKYKETCKLFPELAKWETALFNKNYWQKQSCIMEVTNLFFEWNAKLQRNYHYRYRIMRNKMLFRTAATDFAYYEMEIQPGDFDYVFSYKLYTDVPLVPSIYEKKLIRGFGVDMRKLMDLYPDGLPKIKLTSDDAKN